MEMCPGGTSISEFPKGIAANLTSCPRLADERAQTEERLWPQYPGGCLSGLISMFRSARRASFSTNGGMAYGRRLNEYAAGIQDSRRATTQPWLRVPFDSATLNSSSRVSMVSLIGPN